MLLCVHVTRVLFLVLAGKFRPDYGLLLELHALTLVARSYALLLGYMHVADRSSTLTVVWRENFSVWVCCSCILRSMASMMSARGSMGLSTSGATVQRYLTTSVSLPLLMARYVPCMAV